MAGRHDPGRPVDRGPVVVGAVACRFTDMQSHPDADRGALRPRLPDQGTLGGEAGRDAVVRGAEHRHHAIAHRLHDPSAGLVDRAAEDRVVAGSASRIASGARSQVRVLPSTSVNRNASIRALAVRSSSIQRSLHIEPVDPGVSSVPSIPSGARDTALEHASLDALTLGVADCYDARARRLALTSHEC